MRTDGPNITLQSPHIRTGLVVVANPATERARQTGEIRGAKKIHAADVWRKKYRRRTVDQCEFGLGSGPGAARPAANVKAGPTPRRFGWRRRYPPRLHIGCQGGRADQAEQNNQAKRESLHSAPPMKSSRKYNR